MKQTIHGAVKTPITLLLAIILLAFVATAQDQFFFNTHQTLVFTNPSYAGSNGFIRNQNLFKKSFDGWDDTDSYLSSVDAYVAPLKAGLGLSYQRNEKFGGTVLSNYLAFTYAQHFHLRKKELKIVPSLQVAYGDKTWKDLWLPGAVAQRGITTSFLDISSGLLIVYRHFYIGSTFLHLNEPWEGPLRATRMSQAFSMHASYSTAFSESSMLNLSGRLYSSQRYQAYQVAWNLLFLKQVVIGLGARQESLASVLFWSLGYRNRFMSAGFSYGQSPNKLPTGDLNQSELTFSYFMRDKANQKKLTSFETW